MRLSSLQKYILSRCCLNNGAGVKADFYSFYEKNKSNISLKIIQDIIHKSLESLVEKDLLVAYGKKTKQKWFIHKVKLTSRGQKAAKEIIKERQVKLPIK
ncbi:MAG: hypothetical protein WC582_00550 [Patescibacteria group bacterium]|jgi:hypothetical protein